MYILRNELFNFLALGLSILSVHNIYKMEDELDYPVEVAADELHDKTTAELDEDKQSSTLIKDPNEIKKVEFVLNIQEVPGKKISETYVKELTEKLNAIKQQRTYVQFNIRMVVESDITYGKMMGGDGNSTFPYNIFESAFDLITGKNQNTTVIDETNKNNQVPVISSNDSDGKNNQVPVISDNESNL